MNKVLKKVGLSAVVATFVFGLAGTSSALTPQDPDNETAVIGASADVFVEATNNASYSETEDYTLTLDNGTDAPNGNKTRLTYKKDFKATNGQTHVVSSFDATETASTTKPNIVASNKITFDSPIYTTAGGLLNAGTFTGTERIAYERCQAKDTRTMAGFCAPAGSSVPAATGNIAMGGGFNVQYASITTSADVTAVAYTDKDKYYNVLPSVNYKIDAMGAGVGQEGSGFDYALGSVQAGMKADVVENGITTMAYEQHTAAKGVIKFSKDMHYKSAVKGATSATSNINKVP